MGRSILSLHYILLLTSNQMQHKMCGFDGMTRGGETGVWLCIMRLSLGQAKLGTVLPVSITYFW